MKKILLIIFVLIIISGCASKFDTPEKTIKTLETALNKRDVSTSFDSFFYNEDFLKENNLNEAQLKNKLVTEYKDLKELQNEKNYRQEYIIIDSKIDGNTSTMTIKKCVYSDEWETNSEDCGINQINLLKINNEWKIDVSTARFYDGYY
jgi:hypothetical protein|tara:strand:+ start:94 stop:540 length:447 start_codon:yes stop_codon:yes gene_type:complete